MLIPMALTMMQGHSGLAKTKNQCCMLSATKQAISIKLATKIGLFLCDLDFANVSMACPLVLFCRIWSMRQMQVLVAMQMLLALPVSARAWRSSCTECASSWRPRLWSCPPWSLWDSCATLWAPSPVCCTHTSSSQQRRMSWTSSWRTCWLKQPASVPWAPASGQSKHISWFLLGRTLIGAVPMVTMAQSATNWRKTTLTWMTRIHSHTYINTVTTMCMLVFFVFP